MIDPSKWHGVNKMIAYVYV